MPRWLGRLMHRFGLPGLVREARYDAFGINGIETYFARASGGIEGVGYAGGHRWRVVPRAARLAAAPW